MSNYFTLQLPPEYGVIINSDAFLGAFTMDRGEGRVKTGPWILGPGYRPQQPPDQSPSQATTLPTDYKLIDQEEIRVPMRDNWEKYYRHAAGHIPYAVCKANGAPPLEKDNEDEERDFEMGGIGFEDGDSELETGTVTRSPLAGGRPFRVNGPGRGAGEGNLIKMKFGLFTFIFG
jgi:hypothetical protein